MTLIAYTLEEAETDLRNTYWHIRNSRKTNWKYVNKARWIKEAILRMGITSRELSNAVYCLKTEDCQRCKWTVDPANNIPCWSLNKRRQTMLLNKEKKRS